MEVIGALFLLVLVGIVGVGVVVVVVVADLGTWEDELGVVKEEEEGGNR